MVSCACSKLWPRPTTTSCDDQCSAAPCLHQEDGALCQQPMQTAYHELILAICYLQHRYPPRGFLVEHTGISGMGLQCDPTCCRHGCGCGCGERVRPVLGQGVCAAAAGHRIKQHRSRAVNWRWHAAGLCREHISGRLSIRIRARQVPHCVAQYSLFRSGSYKVPLPWIPYPGR